MKKLVTVLSILLFISSEVALAQTVIFSENFESGLAHSSWGTYYKNEDPLVAKPMSDAPKPLATGGSFIGLLQDADGSYTGSAVAIAGNVTLKNYSIEADVYCYVNQALSAYSGLVVYADSSKKDFYKLRVDFDANDRINFSGLKSDPNTYMPLFSKDFKGVDNPGIYPTADGWHKMKVEVRTVNDTTLNFWCYFDGNLLKGSPVAYHKSTAVTAGCYGLYSFQQSATGLATYFDNIVVTQLATGVEETPNVPTEFSLQQNYPNPFNPETKISFKLAAPEFTVLTIYDLLGRSVKTLVSDMKSAGQYTVTWDGKDDFGNFVPSGVYMYTLKSGARLESKKMILLK